jgi:hypothetical protein
MGTNVGMMATFVLMYPFHHQASHNWLLEVTLGSSVKPGQPETNGFFIIWLQNKYQASHFKRKML